MIKKILFGLATVSLLSGQAFALQIYKGHLISHQEWSTGNAKGFFNVDNNPNTRAKLKRLTLENDSAPIIFVNSTIEPVSGVVGKPVDVKSTGEVSIYNTASMSKNYIYSYGLCSEREDHATQCNYYRDEIELESGGNFNEDNHATQVQLTFNTKGTYLISANTNVQCNHLDSLSSSRSNDVITIS